MPQVDLEAFVSSVCAGGSDRKIACESTLSDDPTTRPYNNNSAVSPTDFPPESYFLSKDAQLEWLSDNAFFDRKDSQRGNSAILNSNPNSTSSSQRFLLKSKASIIGLPKPQKTCFNEAKHHRRNKNRVILKRVGSRIKTDISLLEPSSPKVSCIGKVRSRRERSRRHRQKSGRADPLKEKPDRVKKPGFLATFRAILRIGGGCKDVSAPPSRTHDIRSRLPPKNVEKSSLDGGEPVVPGLGGMTRFASGRREDLLGRCWRGATSAMFVGSSYSVSSPRVKNRIVNWLSCLSYCGTRFWLCCGFWKVVGADVALKHGNAIVFCIVNVIFQYLYFCVVKQYVFVVMFVFLWKI